MQFRWRPSARPSRAHLHRCIADKGHRYETIKSTEMLVNRRERRLRGAQEAFPVLFFLLRRKNKFVGIPYTVRI